MSLRSRPGVFEGADRGSDNERRQQKTASGQVVNAVREIGEGQHQTTESVKQISNIGVELTHLSDKLNLLIQNFKVSDNEDKDDVRF